MMAKDGNNPFITQIVKSYLLTSETPKNQRDGLADSIVKTILSAFSDELKSTDAFNLPYKDITDIIYSSSKTLKSDEIYSFSSMYLKPAIIRKYNLDPIDDRHHSVEQKYVKRFLHIHNKLVEHILLAQTQRDFINRIIEDAVDLARSTNELANSTNEIIDQTKRIANEAEQNAEQANKVAAEAKETADKAEKTYNTMFANYVTILGIFTAIIVTIFGGLNVVDTVISYGNTHFSTIVFLAALVLMCVVCLLYFLAKIILKLNGKDDDNQRFTLECLFGVVFIVCIGLILVAWCASPTKITPDHPTKTKQKAAQ